MTRDFNRILTLLRKEKGITQKKAAEDLGISQALLSHYEKGIRECGLDFVVRAADYYGVSCDYLLGRSADRSGLTLRVDEVPNPETAKDSIYRGSLLPTLNKKLIENSLNILFDKLTKCQSKGLVGEISAYLMLSVYRMFRLLYASSPKNASDLFSVPAEISAGYAVSGMAQSAANTQAILAGRSVAAGEGIRDTSCFAMTTESITREYPLYATSLFNLIRFSEERMRGPAARPDAPKEPKHSEKTEKALAFSDRVL